MKNLPKALATAIRECKRALLLAEITSRENQLLVLAQMGQSCTAYADELRGLLALAYARLESEEFNPAPAGN